jgi:hypothetical protein
MSNIPTNNDPLQRWIQAQSTHQALGARQEVYAKLGLNKPGFWIDLKQRMLKQNPPAEDMPTAAQQPISYSDPYDDTSLNYTADPPIKLNPVKTLKMPQSPARTQPVGSVSGLQQKEKEMVWGQVRDRIRKNPIIGVDGTDFNIAEKNYMDLDVVMQMNADPTKFLSQALIQYYNEKQVMNEKDWTSHATNYEKMSAMTSIVKKRNLKVTGRFITPTESQMNTLQRAKATTATKQLNVKSGGYYSPPLYLSPFGG